MCGFEVRFIMSVSGHRQESSIRNYAKTSDGMKLAMSNAINTTVSKFDLQKKTASPSILQTANPKGLQPLLEIHNHMDSSDINNKPDQFNFNNCTVAINNN